MLFFRTPCSRESSSFKLWTDHEPFIVVARPVTDLCQQNNTKIRSSSDWPVSTEQHKDPEVQWLTVSIEQHKAPEIQWLTCVNRTTQSSGGPVINLCQQNNTKLRSSSDWPWKERSTGQRRTAWLTPSVLWRPAPTQTSVGPSWLEMKMGQCTFRTQLQDYFGLVQAFKRNQVTSALRNFILEPLELFSTRRNLTGLRPSDLKLPGAGNKTCDRHRHPLGWIKHIVIVIAPPDLPNVRKEYLGNRIRKSARQDVQDLLCPWSSKMRSS